MSNGLYNRILNCFEYEEGLLIDTPSFLFSAE